MPISWHFVKVFCIIDNRDLAIEDKGCITTLYGFFGDNTYLMCCLSARHLYVAGLKWNQTF